MPTNSEDNKKSEDESSQYFVVRGSREFYYFMKFIQILLSNFRGKGAGKRDD